MPAFATAEAVPARRSAPRLLTAQASARVGAALCIAAVAIWALGRFTDVDLALADALYDGAARTFPWRDAWLTDLAGHRLLKLVLALLAVSAGLAALGDALWPHVWRTRALDRLRLRIVACAGVVVPLSISLLKQHSNAHCPWDLARYGGTEPYVRLFAALPPGALPGHCLPAGHASSALWLIALAVLWLPDRPRTAARAAGAAIAFGLAVGWMQQMRGAHFLTHTLWSIWIACAIVLALVSMVRMPASRKSSPAGVVIANMK
jgi:membrane-associated PAP2 superfamily phosphatase